MPELDAILGVKIPVLDDGFVRVVDYMGDDAAIVQAARVSYGAGTKKRSDDAGLIRYLMRHRHTTPFEMATIKLHVRVPMDCWRQWIRHRTASVNEYSTRYSEAIDSMQKTPPDEWRMQSGSNKQGSQNQIATGQGALFTAAEQEHHLAARRLYQERLDHGIAREQARKDLPLSTYTEAYWKIDLHNLFHFLGLRADSHAQAEIRAYATAIAAQIVARWVPAAYCAFCDYRLDSMTLSVTEKDVTSALVHGDTEQCLELALAVGWVDAKGKPAGRNRERDECDQKLAILGLGAPWND